MDDPTIRKRTVAAAAIHLHANDGFGWTFNFRTRASTLSANPPGGSRRRKVSRRSSSNRFITFLFQIARCLLTHQCNPALQMAPYGPHRHVQSLADFFHIHILAVAQDYDVV